MILFLILGGIFFPTMACFIAGKTLYPNELWWIGIIFGFLCDYGRFRKSIDEAIKFRKSEAKARMKGESNG